VFPVQLRVATVDVPSSHLIVCVVEEMVSTLLRWKSHPRMSGTDRALTTKNAYSIAAPPK